MRTFTSLITRTQARPAEQRCEERHEGLVESATLFFRGEEHHVPVVNLSSRGTMIECALVPRMGESVIIRFDGFSPMHAFVRWTRDGRIGLNFGGEIVLGI
jgi:hypothetical protein